MRLSQERCPLIDIVYASKPSVTISSAGDNISRKFMHDHATLWTKHSAICHDTLSQNIRYPVITIIVNCAFRDDGGPRWRAAIVQIAHVARSFKFELGLGSQSRNFNFHSKQGKRPLLVFSSLLVVLAAFAAFFQFPSGFPRLNASDSNQRGRQRDGPLYGSLSASVIRNYN
jgi:hypothetical protein